MIHTLDFYKHIDTYFHNDILAAVRHRAWTLDILTVMNNNNNRFVNSEPSKTLVRCVFFVFVLKKCIFLFQTFLLTLSPEY